MAELKLSGAYTDGVAYENFMGRWSRASGRDLVRWLDLPEDLQWLDVGCGTGAFTEVVLDECAPKAVTAIDPSEAQIRYTRNHVSDPRASFEVGDGQALPFASRKFDAAVAALVLNFVSDPDMLAEEMARVVNAAGTVAAYVWDFEGRMNISQHIWQSIAATDPDAPILAGNAARIEIGRPATLSGIFERAGLVDVATRAIDISVTYRDFPDYWRSNDTTTNPIGKYIKSLSPHGYQKLKHHVVGIIPMDDDGGIRFGARAYAVRGIVPRQ